MRNKIKILKSKAFNNSCRISIIEKNLKLWEIHAKWYRQLCNSMTLSHNTPSCVMSEITQKTRANFSLARRDYTVIRFVWVSAKFGTCTVVSVNGTLFEAKMCTFTLESTHFIFNTCPIYTHNGASAKFSTNLHETDYSVGKEYKKWRGMDIVIWGSQLKLGGEMKYLW